MAERLEVELIRELEIAYESGAAPAAVEHASAFQWANACHYLFAAGRIDVAGHAARHLHAIHPRLEYLATLVALFDAVPNHLPPALVFRDDPSAEIQIVARPDCNAVLLCFCAMQGTLGAPLNFCHQWLGRLPVSLVYIKDFRDLAGACGYPSLGPDRGASVDGLRRLIARMGGSTVYTLGVSLGGYPALYYGLELGAAGALSLAGPTDLAPDFIARLGRVSPTHLNLFQRAPDYARNLRDVYESARQRPRVLLAYSAESYRDRRHAERMSGLPNVELIAVSGAGTRHNVVERLIRRRDFYSLLHRFVALSRQPAA